MIKDQKKNLIVAFKRFDTITTVSLKDCFTKKEWIFGSYEFSLAKSNSIFDGRV
jgi:hypothetical protein